MEQKDPRVEWLANYTCKTLRLKEDKWSRMMVSDEQRTYLNRFLEDRWPQASPFFVSYKILEINHGGLVLEFEIYRLNGG